MGSERAGKDGLEAEAAARVAVAVDTHAAIMHECAKLQPTATKPWGHRRASASRVHHGRMEPPSAAEAQRRDPQGEVGKEQGAGGEGGGEAMLIRMAVSEMEERKAGAGSVEVWLAEQRRAHLATCPSHPGR